MKSRPIFVVYLSNGLVHSDFCYALAQLAMYATHRGVHLGITKIECSEIEVGRALAVRTAFEQAPDASHILFLDSDMVFPPNTLERLHNRNKDIVGTTYCQRRSPRGWVHELLNDGVPRFDINSGGCDQIKSTGFGCILIRLDVFRKVPRPWFASIYKGEVDERGEDVRRSEDRSFCDRARTAGYKVWCDFDLSADLRHVGQFAFGPEHIELYQP